MNCQFSGNDDDWVLVNQSRDLYQNSLPGLGDEMLVNQSHDLYQDPLPG